MVGRGRLEFQEHNFGLDGRGHDARQVIRISEEGEYMIHREGHPLFELNLIFHVADCRSMLPQLADRSAILPERVQRLDYPTKPCLSRFPLSAERRNS